MEKNYYELLEVDYNATQEQIKRSYYKLAKKYHPDINPKTANLFKYITAAYNVLSNPKERELYDLTLKYDNLENDLNSTPNTTSKSTYDTNKDFEEDIDVPSYEEIVKAMEELAESLHEYRKTVSKKEFDKQFDQLPEYFKDYFNNYSYYTDPSKEPIFTIIHDFSEYRFENALKAIKQRNILPILGMAIVFLLAFPFVVLGKVFNTKFRIRGFHSKIKWVLCWYVLILEEKFFKTLFWTIYLFWLVIYKIIYNILYGIYFIFKNIIRFFLLPLAVIFATILNRLLFRGFRR